MNFLIEGKNTFFLMQKRSFFIKFKEVFWALLGIEFHYEFLWQYYSPHIFFVCKDIPFSHFWDIHAKKAVYREEFVLKFVVNMWVIWRRLPPTHSAQKLYCRACAIIGNLQRVITTHYHPPKRCLVNPWCAIKRIEKSVWIDLKKAPQKSIHSLKKGG